MVAFSLQRQAYTVGGAVGLVGNSTLDINNASFGAGTAEYGGGIYGGGDGSVRVFVTDAQFQANAAANDDLVGRDIYFDTLQSLRLYHVSYAAFSDDAVYMGGGIRAGIGGCSENHCPDGLVCTMAQGFSLSCTICPD
eukprot:COSAG02_NODE_8760_length_2453_cov_2.563721_2_plen_137_part_01